MARPQATPGLMPSLLDRLTDPESLGTAAQRGYTPRQMMESIRRDLEDLFNTHGSDSEVPETFPEVRRSIVTFGLPDFASLTVRTAGQEELLRRLLLDVITFHEPRLRDVRVVILDPPTKAGRRLRFRIDARLNTDPSPDIAFETVLELTSGQASIRAGDL